VSTRSSTLQRPSPCWPSRQTPTPISARSRRLRGPQPCTWRSCWT